MGARSEEIKDWNRVHDHAGWEWKLKKSRLLSEFNLENFKEIIIFRGGFQP